MTIHFTFFEGGGAPRLRLAIGPVSEQQCACPGLIEVTKMILRDTQQEALGPLGFADRKGNPAMVQPGSIAWTSSDPTVIAVSPSADGLSANVVAGKPGVALLTITADADPGDGVVTLTGTRAYEVQGGLAATIIIPDGVVTEQP